MNYDATKLPNIPDEVWGAFKAFLLTPNQNYGLALKSVREFLGLELLDVVNGAGVTRSWLYAVENCSRLPKAVNLAQLTGFYESKGINVTELIEDLVDKMRPTDKLPAVYRAMSDTQRELCNFICNSGKTDDELQQIKELLQVP